MNKAFTLIEFLIYIGIVGLVLIAAGAIALNILFDKAKLTAIEEVSQNTRFTMEKIANTVRNAQAINSPAISASAPALSLQMADSGKNPTVFDLFGGAVRIKEGAGSAVNLTSSKITVTNLQFSNISYASTPGTIRIQITVKSINPGNRQEYNFEKIFYTTANIRKK